MSSDSEIPDDRDALPPALSLLINFNHLVQAHMYAHVEYYVLIARVESSSSISTRDAL